jgi:hypothetical protein
MKGDGISEGHEYRGEFLGNLINRDTLQAGQVSVIVRYRRTSGSLQILKYDTLHRGISNYVSNTIK